VGSRSNDEFLVFRLHFADDTLIFRKAIPDHLSNLRCVFLCFEAVSRLRINLAKSELVPIGAVEDVEGLACLLGCMVYSLPMKNLGFLLGTSFKG
jgi:hypothetical protein